MEQHEWKSPRKIAEEEKAYRLKRFEDYMVMADKGQVTRALAITALREELAFADQPTVELEVTGGN